MRHHLKLAVAPALLAAACAAPATEQVWSQCPPPGVELQDCVFPDVGLGGPLSDNAQVLNDLCNTPCRTVNSLFIGDLEVDSLKDLKPLARIERVKRQFMVSGNTRLKDLQGLDALVAAERVEIQQNQEMISLHGLENLDDALVIDIGLNPKLARVDAFRSMTSTSDLYLWQNDELVDLASFSALQSLYRLGIDRNKKLKNLNGFQSLSGISATLGITSNESLESLAALKNLRAIDHHSIVLDVFDNPHLPQCQAQALAESIPTKISPSISGNDVTATCDAQQ